MGEPEPTGQQVLIVEDDEAIATGLAMNLRIEGYVASIAPDGETALEQIFRATPDLVVLDITLPHKNGLEVLSEVRAAGLQVPVLVLSARQDEYDKVAALRLGADDYVTKPFALAELLARCAAILRRTRHAAPESRRNTVRFGHVTVDFDTQRVTRGDEVVALTPIEYDLLAFFLRNPAKVFTRERLLREVWGATAGSPRTVDNFMGQLRGKLEVDPDHPRHLITVRGSGYRFDP